MLLQIGFLIRQTQPPLTPTIEYRYRMNKFVLGRPYLKISPYSRVSQRNSQPSYPLLIGLLLFAALVIQKALKGEALNAVRHLFIHPSCVPTIISTLRLLFGQPERILQSIKSKIKHTPSINMNKLETITSFAVYVKSLTATMQACGLSEELHNSSILQELVNKLPPYLQINWGSVKIKMQNQNKRANLLTFSEFIYDIGLSANIVNVGNENIDCFEKKSYVQNPARMLVHTHNVGGETTICAACGGGCKNVELCEVFKQADRNERWNILRKGNLCKCCLKRHYGACNNKKPCGINGCTFKHHSMLHKNFEENKESSEAVDICNAHDSNNDQNVMFKVMPVNILGKNKTVESYVFFDEGSSINLIDKDLAQKLEIEGEDEPLCLQWTGKVCRTEQKSQKFMIDLVGSNQAKVKIEARSVSNLSLPTQTLDYEELCKTYKHLRNLPVKSFKNVQPQLLIGMKSWKLGLPQEIREGNSNEPIAVRTVLGWLIYGLNKNEDRNKSTYHKINVHQCNCHKQDEELNKIVKHFYSIESLGLCNISPRVSKDDERALKIMDSTTKRQQNGHYEVGLLWRFDKFEMPESFNMAFKRLQCLEKKLKNDPVQRSLFQSSIKAYENKGYISIVKKEAKTHVWYLPIFPVFNKNKPGKFRMVWDAAAKAGGTSLNDMLLTGPDCLCSLSGVLYRFRQKKIAFVGDIEEMFHQIFIREEDRQVQRFLWRDCDDSKEPQIFVMNVMIFGASCSPTLSQHVKNANANTFKEMYPKASSAIVNNHYVDDYLDSVDTVSEAKKLISEVTKIHSRGGFKIRNWIANNRELKNYIKSEVEPEHIDLDITAEKETEKVLGIYWKPDTDTIEYKISNERLKEIMCSGTYSPTKRQLLRVLMTVFDPLGLIGHLLMALKILLQDVWRSHVGWDEIIHVELQQKWLKWIDHLQKIHELKIKRCYLKNIDTYCNVEVQLHTFVDASESGYAAVSYFRITCDGKTDCSLVASKTRVAPLKSLSIPRLELMAALIGARLAKNIEKEHSIRIKKKVFWSDSQTVLSWLNADSRKYHQFIAFRVTEILDLTDVAEWRWVPTRENVADDATRVNDSLDISSDSRWFNGPQFLARSESEWPKQIEKSISNEELKHRLMLITTHDSIINFERFSNWTRLLRAIAYVFRFKNACKKQKSMVKELQQEELYEAEMAIYKQAQLEAFGEDINLLQQRKDLKKTSCLYKLNAYLDSDGVLRSYGRLDEANISFELKRLVILPRQSYICKLIILYHHKIFKHAFQETVVNEIRQKYYIPKLRRLCRSVLKDCQHCKIHKAVPVQPQMSNLPRARLAQFCAPFTYTGVDYFGPLTVVVNRHREKRYGVLFTCLTIRAIHIEIAHSLDTNSCVLAIRNFMARRGTPKEIFSDNGTNFIAAEKELKKGCKEIDANILTRNFTTSTSKWNFNPPAAPHMGGAWERLVRTVKTVLYSVLPVRAPTDEILRNMMAEVENIVNSRPLTYMPIDINCPEALTPNHFLLGTSNGIKPTAVLNDDAVLVRQNWLVSQKFAQMFWKRWLVEYLPEITRRTKWHEKVKPIKVGDLVIVVDPKFHRNVWPKGRVIEIKQSKDNQVRSATIQTCDGVMERPACKLAVLDVQQNKKV